MIHEETIIKKINGFYEQIDSSSSREVAWKNEHPKLHNFLSLEYSKAPKDFINLFWRLDADWLALAEDEKWKNGNDRYADELHSVILNLSTLTDQNAIKFACDLMVYDEELYKEDTAMFLAKAKNPASVPFLIEALNADDYAIVRESAYALAAIQDVRAEIPIIEIVDRYNMDWVYGEGEKKDDFFDGRADYECAIIRANLFNALCLLKTPKAHEKVLQTTLGDRDLGSQMRCLRYLIHHALNVAPAYLKQLVDSPIEEVATFAQEHLEKLS